MWCTLVSIRPEDGRFSAIETLWIRNKTGVGQQFIESGWHSHSTQSRLTIAQVDKVIFAPCLLYARPDKPIFYTGITHSEYFASYPSNKQAAHCFIVPQLDKISLSKCLQPNYQSKPPCSMPAHHAESVRTFLITNYQILLPLLHPLIRKRRDWANHEVMQRLIKWTIDDISIPHEAKA